MRTRAERTLGSYLANIGRVLDLHLPLFNRHTGNAVVFEGEVTDIKGDISFLFKTLDGQLVKLGMTQVHEHLTNKDPVPESRGDKLMSGFVNVQYKGPRSSYQTSITRKQNGMPFKSEEEAMAACVNRQLTMFGDPIFLCKLTPVKMFL